MASLWCHGDDNLHGSGTDRAWILPTLLGRISRASGTAGCSGRNDREILRHAHARDRRDNKPAESRIGNSSSSTNHGASCQSGCAIALIGYSNQRLV